MEHAKKYTAAKISDETVTEVRDVAPHTIAASYTNKLSELSSHEIAKIIESFSSQINKYDNLFIQGRSKRRSNKEAIFEWVRRLFGGVEFGKAGLNLIATSDGEYFGFGVSRVGRPTDLLSGEIRSKLSRGFDALIDGEILTYTLVITMNLIPPRELFRSKSTQATIENMVSEFSGVGIVVGVLNSEVGFVPVLKSGAVPSRISVMDEAFTRRDDDNRGV